MSQLSRKQRYQELRDQIDENTTQAAASSMDFPRPYGNIDYTGAHSAKPLHSWQKQPEAQKQQLPKSEVMNDLLGEVKQYNIDNGTRLEDDTQINILRTLDSSSDQLKRSRHMIAMEEEEKGGSTMRISRQARKEEPESRKARAKAQPVEITDSIILSQNLLADLPADNDELSILGFEEETAVPVKTEEKKPEKTSFFQRLKKAAPKAEKTETAAEAKPDEKTKKEAVQEEPEKPVSKLSASDLPTPPAFKPAENSAAEDEEKERGLSILFDEPFESKKPAVKDTALEEDDLKDEPKSSFMNAGNILILILILVLLASVALTVFLLMKSGLL